MPKKTTDNVMLTDFRRGKPVKAIDMHAILERTKAHAQHAHLAKGHADAQVQAVVGGANRQITHQGAWIRCISADNASSYSAMEIYNADFVCGEIRVWVRKAEKKFPKNGPVTLCTNGRHILRQNQNGWVRFVQFTDGPAKFRAGIAGAPRGEAPPKL